MLVLVVLKRLTVAVWTVVALSVAVDAFANQQIHLAVSTAQRSASPASPLPVLDARSFSGVREISKAELIALMSKARALTAEEIKEINRGCLGLICLYQGLGVRRWPEEAPGTRAFLRLEDALARRCPEGRENFVFVKQAWWVGTKAPTPHPVSGEVPLSSVTRMKVGWYTFNYAVYFPSTATYAWINHREHGFPVNIINPQRAYLSTSPPPLDENRPAQLYCSTCK